MAASMDENLELVDSDDYYAWLGLSKEVSECLCKTKHANGSLTI